MKEVSIQDLMPGVVQGVTVQLPSNQAGYRESFFEWTASSLVAQFEKKEISGGVLRSWHHTPNFKEIETHTDAEMFYFISGVALMIFVDVEAGCPKVDSAQIVRIQPGTQIIISAGKGHFVAVAEGDEPVSAIVISPRMEAPRIALPEGIAGV